MELLDKLTILSDAAKYDAACTSSGVKRGVRPGMIGNTSSSIAGCCHSFSADGRCVTLLKVLMSNACVYDCKYCVNRRSNDTRRARMLCRISRKGAADVSAGQDEGGHFAAYGADTGRRGPEQGGAGQI